MQCRLSGVDIEIIKSDITNFGIEGIVNPANSSITMGGGLAGVIWRKGGDEIRKEAQKHTPVAVGEAVITGAGELPAKFVIHAPTMEKPAMKIPVENVRLAMRAVLECAEENNISEVAIPGLGTGVGGVSYSEAAQVIVDEVKKFKAKNLKKVILVAFNDELYKTFQNAMS